MRHYLLFCLLACWASRSPRARKTRRRRIPTRSTTPRTRQAIRVAIEFHRRTAEEHLLRPLRESGLPRQHLRARLPYGQNLPTRLSAGEQVHAGFREVLFAPSFQQPADSWLVERLVTRPSICRSEQRAPQHGGYRSREELDQRRFVPIWTATSAASNYASITGYIAVDGSFNRLDTARLDGNPCQSVPGRRYQHGVLLRGPRHRRRFMPLPIRPTTLKSCCSRPIRTISSARSARTRPNHRFRTSLDGAGQRLHGRRVRQSISTIAVNDGQHTDAVFPRNESLVITGPVRLPCR